MIIASQRDYVIFSCFKMKVEHNYNINFVQFIISFNKLGGCPIDDLKKIDIIEYFGL